MRSVSYTCDICGANKGKGNKWLLAYREAERIKRITLSGWNDETAAAQDSVHLCSEACAFSLASRVLRVGW